MAAALRQFTEQPSLGPVGRKGNAPRAIFRFHMQLPLPLRTSAYAHAAIPHANPLSVHDVAALLSDVANRSPATALDIGCGPGSIAVQLAKLCHAEILAVDINTDFLERAMALAISHGVENRIKFSARSAAELPAEKYDLVTCIGASQAFGRPTDAITACRAKVTELGAILFADLVWCLVPPEALTQLLGVSAEYYWHVADEDRIFAENGLKIAKRLSASAEDWQRYEAAVYARRKAYAATLDATESAKLLTWAEAWKCAFDKMACECLGFTAYIAVPA